MEQYHLTIYQKCPHDDSVYSSPEFLRNGAHLISFLSVPTSIYGAYCVIYNTPKKMASAKWVLLNVHFWTVVTDVIFNIISIPMLFFPSASGLMLGSGELTGIPPKAQFYVIQVLVAVYSTAVIALFENRHYVIQTRWKIRKTWVRVLMHVFNLLVATFTVLPSYLTSFDKEAVQLEFLRMIPCPAENFFDPDVFIVTDHPVLFTMLMGIQTAILASQTLFFLLHTWYNLVYVNSSRVSAATHRLQLKFLIGSFFQITIPVLLVMFPIFYIWFSVDLGYFNQKANNLAVLSVSSHGFFATICMILVHRPYREHFLRMVTFGKVSKKNPCVRVSAVHTSIKLH